MINAFKILVAAFFLFALSGCPRSSQPITQEAVSKPNVLFIAVDDLRAELGVYGALAKSPNMDALANSGSLFTHHYVQVPTCGASRHALLTGMRPSKPEHLSNQAIVTEISDSPEGEHPETFIHKFKREGYHTVGIGKISHSADGYVYGYEEPVSDKKELPHSWSELLFDHGQWGTGWNAFFGYADGTNRQGRDKQVKPYEAGEVDDEGYPDGLTANLALGKLRELKDSDKPFFMGVGFFKPHLPFNAPKKYWDLYNRDSIPVSSNPDIPENINTASLQKMGEFNQYALGEEKASLDKSVSDAYAKKLRHGYLASISYTDALIGKLVKELETLGLADNTIIVVWGDHGWHLGDQRVWGKHTLFENALRSSLIINTPDASYKSKRIETIVESVDIYPTLLELCDLPLNYDVDGESLVSLMKQDVSDIKTSQKKTSQEQDSGEENSDQLTAQNLKTYETAYGYFNRGITLRTPNYRLTKYFRDEQPVVELYDHTENRVEDKNIAAERSDIVEELMPLLEAGNNGLYSLD